jgi:hypothetical protein
VYFSGHNGCGAPGSEQKTKTQLIDESAVLWYSDNTEPKPRMHK